MTLAFLYVKAWIADQSTDACCLGLSLYETQADSGCRVEHDHDRASLRLQVFEVHAEAQLEILDVVGGLNRQLVVCLDARMKLVDARATVSLSIRS